MNWLCLVLQLFIYCKPTQYEILFTIFSYANTNSCLLHCKNARRANGTCILLLLPLLLLLLLLRLLLLLLMIIILLQQLLLLLLLMILLLLLLLLMIIMIIHIHTNTHTNDIQACCTFSMFTQILNGLMGAQSEAAH